MNARHFSIIGGVATLALAALAYAVVGHVYSSGKAIDLITRLTQPALYFGSAIATSSATTLALMLTAIGMAHRVDADFDDRFYRNVYHISILSTLTLLGSVLLLLVLTLPIGQFKVGPSWFIWLYRVLFIMVGMLSSLLVAMVLLVFATVRALIINVTPGDIV